MLRGSWEPGQQMGLPEPLTKPTSPSQADQCAGPAPPPILPWDPEWSNRGHEGIHWSKPVWGVGAGRSAGQARGRVCSPWPTGAEPARATQEGCFGILLQLPGLPPARLLVCRMGGWGAGRGQPPPQGAPERGQE